nr:preprotein translocase subunit SCY2, chloroplastic isoform X3 [Solanum lycopersicum]
MEAAILCSYTPLSTTADLRIRAGKFAGCNLHFYNLPLNRIHIPLKLKFSESSRRHFSSRKGLILSHGKKELSSYFTHQLSSDYTSIRAASGETLHYGQSSSVSEDEGVSLTSTDANECVSLQPKQKQFRNRFLNFVRLGSVVDNAAESFFKSEIRRRLFMTAILIVISRIGYFIPLPGFDRRLIPEDYLSFVSKSVDQLGDSTPELKLSLFQLGVSPQIAASILMQVLCHVLPSLVKLRKEGLDGHEKIKGYIWWISLGFAILEALILSCHSLPYSIYAANHRSRINFDYLCGHFDWLYRYIAENVNSNIREDSLVPAVEPYIPFNINPAGMQPILVTSYLLALPGILASLLGSRFWEHIRDALNPDTSHGADPWVYYTVYAFFVFLFNIFDIANMPKEIADYLNKIGARIPSIKPGKATIAYLTKIQASTRFWGGLLLSVLATTSSILDHYLRRINEGYAIGLTSVLIIVGSIIELRRSYQAYNVMPSLSMALKRYGV